LRYIQVYILKALRGARSESSWMYIHVRIYNIETSKHMYTHTSQVGASARLSLPFSLAQNGMGGVQQLDDMGNAQEGDVQANQISEEDPQDAIDSAQAEVESAKQRVIEDAKRLHDIADAIKDEQVCR
jgi:hypothetical protein